MTDDRLIWDRLVAQICQETGLEARTSQKVLRIVLRTLATLPKETADAP